MEWKIPLFKTFSDQADIDAVASIIRRGTYWAAGPEIEVFEKNLADFLGVKYVLSFNSGTSALHILLLAHGIRDKEVIVPSFTFVATSNAVILAGGTPVFAESEEETFGLDAGDIEKRITERTKAIITINYGGFPSRDMMKLRRIADKHGLVFIEDSAESLGSRIGDKKIGTIGHSAIFSFCQNKVVSTGEGGVLVTESQEVYEKAKLLRSHGRVEEAKDYFSNTGDNDYIEVGYNYRLPTMLAALGCSQLKKIDLIAEKRRSVGRIYDEGLSKNKEIELPKELSGYYAVYQMYTIKLKDQQTRDALQNHLEKKGIMTKVYFNPVHLKTIYTRDYGCKAGDLPRTEELSGRVLTLPLYPHMTRAETGYVVESINEFFQ